MKARSYSLGCLCFGCLLWGCLGGCAVVQLCVAIAADSQHLHARPCCTVARCCQLVVLHVWKVLPSSLSDAVWAARAYSRQTSEVLCQLITQLAQAALDPEQQHTCSHCSIRCRKELA